MISQEEELNEKIQDYFLKKNYKKYIKNPIMIICYKNIAMIDMCCILFDFKGENSTIAFERNNRNFNLYKSIDDFFCSRLNNVKNKFSLE